MRANRSKSSFQIGKILAGVKCIAPYENGKTRNSKDCAYCIFVAILPIEMELGVSFNLRSRVLRTSAVIAQRTLGVLCWILVDRTRTSSRGAPVRMAEPGSPILHKEHQAFFVRLRQTSLALVKSKDGANCIFAAILAIEMELGASFIARSQALRTFAIIAQRKLGVLCGILVTRTRPSSRSAPVRLTEPGSLAWFLFVVGARSQAFGVLCEF